MPYPNEHAARLMDPKLFDNFRRVNNHLGEGIHAIFGRLKSDGGWRLQAIRFDASRYSPAWCLAWLRAHGYRPILFEPAAG